jgi:hypothetical protein
MDYLCHSLTLLAGSELLRAPLTRSSQVGTMHQSGKAAHMLRWNVAMDFDVRGTIVTCKKEGRGC